MDNGRRKKFRSGRRHKRKFYGNQHSRTRDATKVSGDEQQQQHQAGGSSVDHGVDIGQQTDNTEAPLIESASKRKLDTSTDVCELTDGRAIDKLSGFRLVDLRNLACAFQQCCVCKSCRFGTLVLSEDKQRKSGLSSCLELTCTFCDRKNSFCTSSRCDGSKVYEVN